MRLLDQIHLQLAEHEMLLGNNRAPTVYAGRKQMDELRALFAVHLGVTVTTTIPDQVMGMPLIEVVADDYLRVA